jgi:hypothetical protein
MAKTRLRDLVIVLPGITGSVLARTAADEAPVDVWAPSGQALWQGLKSLGDSVRALEVPTHDPRHEPPETGFSATRVVQDLHGVLGLGKIDGYTALTKLVTDQFVVTPGRLDDKAAANFFEFPYDWRLSNRHSAEQLRDFVKTRLERWRTASNGAPDAKVMLLAHSMGGLVSRYYLEVLDGWRDCRALITFGTPYRGAVNAMDFIANGYKASFLDMTAVLRSCPAVYELLPVYKALSENGTWRRVSEGPLPNAVTDYVAAATEFHDAIKQGVDAHLKDPEYLRDRYRIFPFVGVSQPTLQSATLEGGRKLRAGMDRPDWIDEALEGGDGTVPRVSATPIELSDDYRETFFAERHASLQNNESALDDVRERIRQLQSKGLGEIQGTWRPGVRPAISLGLEDLYLPGEPVVLHASVGGGKVPGLTARITAAAGETTEHPFVRGDSGWTLRLDGLPAGLYRVRVRSSMGGETQPTPVRDLFEISGA